MRCCLVGESNGSSVWKKVVDAVRNEWEKLWPETNNLADLKHLVQGLKEVLPMDEVPKIQLERAPRSDMRDFDEGRISW